MRRRCRIARCPGQGQSAGTPYCPRHWSATPGDLKARLEEALARHEEEPSPGDDMELLSALEAIDRELED